MQYVRPVICYLLAFIYVTCCYELQAVRVVPEMDLPPILERRGLIMSKRKNTNTFFNNSKISVVLVTLLTVIMVFSFTACKKEQENKTLTLATTTSVYDSGLLSYLQPTLEKDTGLELKIVAQGTGQAIKTAEDGNADVLLVHDKKSEEAFVSAGHGVERIELMYNYFVIVGPSNDPAKIGELEEKNAALALKQIMENKAPFVSRGDDSGTHKKENSLWKEAGVEPSGDWYISAGKGMADVLLMAEEKQAYALTDKATYLSLKDKLSLEILLESAENLKNQYTIIQVNPEKHEGINSKGAEKFIKWMTSEKALKMIAEYGVKEYGANLFTVNYEG